MVAATLVLILHLVAVTWFDLRRQIIPNMLNLSLGICGVIVWSFVLAWPLWQALVEAAVAYGVLYVLGEAYKRVRGVQGLGGGDIKFMAAATCWTGIIALPWLVLIAAISGLAFVTFKQIWIGEFDMSQRLPFGPHLSLGLLVVWLLRDTLSFSVT